VPWWVSKPHYTITHSSSNTDGRTRQPGPPFWDDVDAALTRAVDELIVDGTINEPTWATLAAHLDKQQLLDVVFTVGTYDLLAPLFNALQMGVDDDIPALMKRYDQLF